MKLLAALPLLLPAVHAMLCEDFTLNVVADEYNNAVVLKSLDYPGYYAVNTLGGPGVIFKFGNDNILVDSDQVSLIVDEFGDMREALTGEKPTTGFFFDNYNLKLASGDFYACRLLQPGILGLRVGYQQDCTKVELVKARPYLLDCTV